MTKKQAFAILDKLFNDWVGKKAFFLYDTHGLPVEMTLDFVKRNIIGCKKNFLYEHTKR